MKLVKNMYIVATIMAVGALLVIFHVEMGVSKLLSGVIQSIMLIFPILALIVPVGLDEGLSMLMIHILGILLFDELSLLI